MKSQENHIHSLFRIILWFLPAICVSATAMMVAYWTLPITIIAGIIFNIAFLIGAGWFSATLCSHIREETNGNLFFIVKFVCLQLIIIPLELLSLELLASIAP